VNVPGTIILAILSSVVLLGPRRWALLGMVAGVLFLTEGEAVDVLGVNMFAIRFLEVAGFIRVSIRKEFDFSKLNKIDKLFLWFNSYTTVVFLIRSSEGHAYQIGAMVDALFCYFTFRGLVQNIEDFKQFLSDFVFLLVPYFILVVIQGVTANNPFAIVGGSQSFMFRHGRPRCFGTFRHPDLLGSFAVTFLPLFIGYGLTRKKRFHALLGIISCLGIVFFTNSGGPMGALAVSLVGWLLWPMRNKMGLVRRSLAAMLAIVALFMKSSIWYLPARASEIFGGHGWHRSYLMDVAFKNIGKWWLAGMPIAETKNWFPYLVSVTGGADITNQYLHFGLYAGLGSMILFIVLLIQAFRSLGVSLRASYADSSVCHKFMLWGLGVMLSVHIINWINVSYFDQFSVIWFLQLSVISSVTIGTNIVSKLDKT